MTDFGDVRPAADITATVEQSTFDSDGDVVERAEVESGARPDAGEQALGGVGVVRALQLVAEPSDRHQLPVDLPSVGLWRSRGPGGGRGSSS